MLNSIRSLGLTSITAVSTLLAQAQQPAPPQPPSGKANTHHAVLFVRFVEGASAEQTAQAHQSAGQAHEIWRSTLVSGLVAIELPTEKSGEALDAYAKNATVYYAQRSGRAHASSQTTPYGINLIHAPQVWPSGRGQGVRLAVVDTGVDLLHADLPSPVATASFVPGEQVQDFAGHGTHCSGIALARDNDIGVVGVAPSTDLLIAKSLDNTGSGDWLWVAQGVEWAVQNGAKVISMSLGGDYSQGLADVISAASNQGILVVAAAGNDASDEASYPAGLPEVLSVSAVDSQRLLAYYSNFGPTVDIAAPGDAVLSTVPQIGSRIAWGGNVLSGGWVPESPPYSIMGRLVYCGAGLDPSDFPATVVNNIALVERRRGFLDLDTQWIEAFIAGATGLIVINDEPRFFEGFTYYGPIIPIATVSPEDGATLRLLGTTAVNLSAVRTGSTYTEYSGTSMAAPHVAGLASLLISMHEPGRVTRSLLREAIERGAADVGPAGIDNLYGWGLVDAVGAKRYLDRMLGVTCPADLDDGSGRGHPDGGVTTDDLLYFVSEYSAGGISADLDDGSGTGTPDGGVTIEDLLFFVAIYLDGGCESLLHAPLACSAINNSSTPNLDVVITWQDRSSNETSFQVFRSIDHSNWRLIGEVPANAVQFVDSRDLVDSQRFFYKVRAVRDIGSRFLLSNFSNEDDAVPTQSVLAAPSNCNAARDDSTPQLDVVITWQDNSEDETGFRIARSVDRETWSNVGEVGTNVTSFRDTRNLVGGQRYWYKVRGFIQTPTGRLYSAYSNEESSIPRTPTVAAPTNCVAARDDVTTCLDVVITWQDNANNETGYNIARSVDQVNWDQVGEVGSNITVYRDTGTSHVPLVADQRYYYHVRAKLEVPGQATIYSPYSNTDDTIPRAPTINAPTNLTASRDGLSVVVVWQDNAVNETGYNIARSTDQVNWDQIGSVGANITTFRDAGGLISGRRYYYHVRAKIEGCLEGTHYSDYSNSDSAIPRSTLLAPTNLVAARDNSTACLDVLISWQDNAMDETGYNIARSEDLVNWDQVGEVGADESLFRDSGSAARPLVAGRQYFYHVRAKREISGEPTEYSDYSNADNSIPLGPSIAAPTNLVAARDDGTPQLDVVITWTDNATNETGYNIARSTDQVSWNQIGSVLANVSSFRDTGQVGGIVSGRRYYYHVRAKIEGCFEGPYYSEYSNTDDAIPR